METKPTIPINQDGNIFSIMGTARSAMREAGVDVEKRNELASRVMDTESYEEALRVIMEYVDFA